MFTKFSCIIFMICSHTEVPPGFVSSFSSTLSRTWSYHFSFRSNSHFPDRSQRPQPHCHVSLCVTFVYVSSAHELTIWLIVLLLCLHIIIVTSSFPRFILSYYLSDYKKPLVTLDFNGKKNYHYKCAVGINHSYRSTLWFMKPH